MIKLQLKQNIQQVILYC